MKINKRETKMIQKFSEIKIDTEGQRLINISKKIDNFVEKSKITYGILNLSILHTSASLIIQENALVCKIDKFKIP